MNLDIFSIQDNIQALKKLYHDGDFSTGPKRKINEYELELNTFYWTYVDQVIRDAIDPENFKFIMPEIDEVVLDFGILNEKCFNDYKKEYNNKTAKTLPFQVQYFAEWIEEKFLDYTSRSNEMDISSDTVSSPILNSLVEFRKKIYSSLAYAFNNIPGLNENSKTMILGGQFDGQKEDLSVSLLENASPSIFNQRNRVSVLLDNILGKVKSTIRDDKSLAFFDRLSGLNAKVYSEKKLLFYRENQDFVSNQSQVIRRTNRDEVLKYLSSQIKILKAAFFLGVDPVQGGKVSSAIIEVKPIIRKTVIESIFNRIRDCDTSFPGAPNVLILPYSGKSFYQWDADTIFLPICPSATPEDSVIHGYAIYRLTYDSMKGDSILKTLYKDDLGITDFRNEFLQDYSIWIKNYATGKEEGLSLEKEEFFKKHMGVNTDYLVPTPRYRTISPREKEVLFQDCYSRIQNGSQERDDFYHIILHLIGKKKLELARRMFIALIEVHPDDAFVLYNLAVFCHYQGDDARAQKVLDLCIEKGATNIWSVYAKELKRKYKDG